jgi:hypothetical protein
VRSLSTERKTATERTTNEKKFREFKNKYHG